MSFLTTGIYTTGCIVPVTTEDPELIVKETKPCSKKWGIVFFLGNEPIALINEQTDLSTLHRSIMTCPVTLDNAYVGSVANRITPLWEYKPC
jgi:hypothetical protein